MKRLIYSPKVNAWVKTDESIVDLSPFITRGSVNRKVNQVSPAQLTIKNPKNHEGRMIFTEHQRKDGSIGPLLHPMDPIIIVLTRIRDKPVQVFTGYCDSTPYLQLFPGTVTVQASCTLKRLLHTYWDPGLPFTVNFLASYGWFPNPQVGGISSPNQETQALKDVKSFNDGSIGNLLAAVLENIGGWDPSTFYIEPLPTTIGPLVTQLFQRFQQINKDNKQTQGDFESLLTSLIGSGGFGTGAPGTDPTGGTGKGGVSLDQFAKWAIPAGKKYGILPSILFGICQNESNFGTDRGPSSAGAIGLMQFIPDTAKAYHIDANNDEQAVFGAAHLLSDNGGMANIHRAIFAYNHSDAYVNSVLSAARNYTKYDHQ